MMFVNFVSQSKGRVTFITVGVAAFIMKICPERFMDSEKQTKSGILAAHSE